MTYISSMLTSDRSEVLVWERNREGRVCRRYPAPYYFYVKHKSGESKDLFGNTVKRFDFEDFSEFKEAKELLKNKRYSVYESDIAPDYKVLSEHYYDKEIKSLNITLYDIEVDYDPDVGHASVANPYAPVSSIAIYHKHTNNKVVLAVPPKSRKGMGLKNLPEDVKNSAEIRLFEDERSLLKAFLKEIEDSDIISGWNSAFFDDGYVYERLNRVVHKKAGDKLSFNGAKRPYYREVERFGKTEFKLVLHGRVALDYLEIYKKFEPGEKASYALEAVADDELPDLPKLSYKGSLHKLYNEDFDQFLRYNIRDTDILEGLENKKGYIELAIKMSHMSTCQIPDVLGTIKLSECSLINYCHYEKDVIVPDSAENDTDNKKFDGATVLDPIAGLKFWTASMDIQSLYPSTMRSLNISPETLVANFANGKEDYKTYMNGSEETIHMVFEGGDIDSRSVKEWKAWIKENNYVVSAAGVIFRQDFIGVIPAVLTAWFDERKEYKRLKAKAEDEGDTALATYYDQIQTIKKLSLNSMYGATGNKYFKFFDIRIAESTTLSGREVLMHMGKKIAELMDGEYKFPSESITYGDTDSVVGDSIVTINGEKDTIENWFERMSKDVGSVKIGEKEYTTYSEKYNTPILNKHGQKSESKIRTIYRHKTKKKMYRIRACQSGRIITITEDHSIIVYRNGTQKEIPPAHLKAGDKLIRIM